MRHGAKLNLLFALALLPLLSAFFQPVTAIATDLAGMGALLLGAWLTRDGVRAEDAFAERKVARRPAIPRKIFGAVAMGVGVALLVFGGQWAIVPALLIGVIAAALHLGAFGLDPLRDKGMEGVDRMQSDRIARKIDEAEKLLDQMRDAIRRARDTEAEDRVAGFSETVRSLFDRSKPIRAIWQPRGATSASICKARAMRPCNSPISMPAAVTRRCAPTTWPFSMISTRISPAGPPRYCAMTAPISTSRPRCCATVSTVKTCITRDKERP